MSQSGTDKNLASAEVSGQTHATRIGVIWLILTAIVTPLVYFVLGPHLPPGGMSDDAASQRFDNTVLAAVATPVVLFVWTYFAYALVNFRDRTKDEIPTDGPPIKGSLPFQVSWLVVTSVTVLSLFVFGTYELIAPAGAGTGSGDSPIWTPAGYSTVAKDNHLLQVQVIGQQWRWSFRYPQYHGVETSTLEIPAGTEVQFNVTSLDVIHSFWPYELAVKADANPGVNNIAFVKATHLGVIHTHCAELCGTLHGAMVSTGHVVSQADFTTWIGGELTKHAKDIPLLPPYATTYLPQVDGGFYDPGQDPLPAEPNSPTTN